MTDEFDIDALLEEPFKEQKPKKSKHSKRSHRSRSRSRSRSRERRKHDHDRRHRRERSRDRHDKRERPVRETSPNLTPQERDARTIYVWQMSSKVQKRDLFDFFSAVGRIRTVRLILDPKTGKSKGMAYIEFREIESAQLGISLTGTKLLGVPLQVQAVRPDPTREAEYAKMQAQMEKRSPSPKRGSFRCGRDGIGPCKLYVGSLHYNITEDMLRGIFEPFGRIDSLRLVRGTDGRSQGYGYISYADSDSAKKAVQHLDGFQLAGRPIKVSTVSDKADMANFKILDEDTGKGGINMGATGRLALMAKLAEGTGIEMPKSALAQLHISEQNPALGTAGGMGASMQTTAPNGTQCFLLSNMFDPAAANHATFQEIREDVVDECAKYGGVLHLFIDKTSAQGNVYVKCPSIATAGECVNRLHGRYFSGRMITAAYVPIANYHKLFPDSTRFNRVVMHASQL